MRHAVFLDRDGVINRAFVRDGKSYPPSSLAELEILPAVPQALRALAGAGFVLIVVTNQPDVAKGTQRRDVVETMHERLKAALPLTEIRVCYHQDSSGCSCRKPKPGLLLEAAEQHDLDMARSYMVGDRWRDIDCGRAAGCYTIFVDSGHSEPLNEQPDARCTDLKEAADLILSRSGKTVGRVSAD